MTTVASHNALKLIAWCTLTFDETLALPRAEPHTRNLAHEADILNPREIVLHWQLTGPNLLYHRDD